MHGFKFRPEWAIKLKEFCDKNSDVGTLKSIMNYFDQSNGGTILLVYFFIIFQHFRSKVDATSKF